MGHSEPEPDAQTRDASKNPRLRVLKLRIRIRTEGAATNQPRATPWETATTKGNALKGHNKRVRRTLFCPFRATTRDPSRNPGRCPGLPCFGPVGATMRNFKTFASDSDHAAAFQRFVHDRGHKLLVRPADMPGDHDQ